MSTILGMRQGLGSGGAGAAEEDDQQHQNHHQQPSGLGMNNSGSTTSIARFPKLDECAHFHYEVVELGRLEVSLSESEQSLSGFAVRVTSGDACWILQRSYDNLVMFDRQLHRCIFDRSYSQLAELESSPDINEVELATLAHEYLRRFSSLSHEGLNCGPVLNWLQLDNRGRRILVPEADSCPINTPAVAAAYAVRPHRAQATDEISFQVGDMISVIDMPPSGESSWWRGKRGFDVGFFPADCVAVIGDKLPRHLATTTTVHSSINNHHVGSSNGQRSQQPIKPVLRKHGKLIAFFRSFILNRPSRRRLKQSGILRERVFGCDLGEHLLNTGREVPSVLSCCAEFIERRGLVDGIYRLSGVTSNIQRLRHAFDEDRLPALHDDECILQDIHSVASLLKMYFRELPNPLCTYQLYSTFVSAVQSTTDAERLARMRDAVRKLPPPHYRTLEYLMRHLVRVAARGEETGMTPRNVAIVWAPNLLRCKELEVGGVAALQGVGVQAVVTEFLICYAELIFAAGPSGTLSPPGQRPKSLAIVNNSSRLLTLEEARSRSLAPEPELIDVGPGAAGLPARYHTVIELPAGQRKRTGSKRSPSLNWRALFGRATGGPTRQSTKTRHQDPLTRSAIVATSTSAATSSSSPTSTPIVNPTLSSESEKVTTETERLQLRPIKSDNLDVASATEDGLGPLLLAPTPGVSSRTGCGHSRSVSHDSYFEHTTSSAPSAAASALDLSEIQLSFESEEREMRMLSGEESLEASPRRQRPKQETVNSSSGSDDGVPCSGITVTGGANTLVPIGGSKRKRSRLEERLQCEVELRFIDSQSPDQIMVSADVHETETPSPLPTPGYLPLLSEASTPLTPNASPRISFKSFSMPLEVDEIKSPSLAISLLADSLETNQNKPITGQQLNSSFLSSHIDFVDQEMILCDKETTNQSSLQVSLVLKNIEQRDKCAVEQTKDVESIETVDQKNNTQSIDNLNLPNTTEQSFPMICEHNYENVLPLASKTSKIENLKNTCDTVTELNDNYEEAKNWLMSDTPNLALMSSPTKNESLANIDVLENFLLNNERTLCYSSSDTNSKKDFHTSSNDDGNSNCANLMENKSQPSQDLMLENNNISSSSFEINRTNFEIIEDSVKNSNYQNDNKTEDLHCESIRTDKSEKNKTSDIENKVSGDLNNIGFNKKVVEIIDSIEEKSKSLGDVKPKELDSCKNEKYKKKCDETRPETCRQENSEVVVPLESAAIEPQEMAHVPAVISEASPFNSNNVSPSSNNNKRLERNSLLQKDTATILQELALQRLSGGNKMLDTTRKRLDSDYLRDRRSFDSEIGREIVREHKMKQELKDARGKIEESFKSNNNNNQANQATHLPPCLRARHARTTRAALSRSLDEAKFNKLSQQDVNSGTANSHKRQQQQLGSTPDFGKNTDRTVERTTQQLNKNLGLDLDDPRCRERIEKYKEERRMFLRDKYRSESFRATIASSVNDNNKQQLAVVNNKKDNNKDQALLRLSKPSF